MTHRYSSRQRAPGERFLADRLQEAVAYDRIAGYFSSSVLEIAGEQLAAMPGKIRMVCNSSLDPLDVQTAQAAVNAVTLEWKTWIDSVYQDGLKPRLELLHSLLQGGKLEVRVLPDAAFGLVHGKAGVITYANGAQTSFLGSANESRRGWALNYELVWEDSSPEAVAWVQEEFDSLWQHPSAVPLAEAVIEDIQRLGKRVTVSHDTWKESGARPESAVVESPVYRQQYGLWAHQKYFVKRAYEEHLSGRGARFVLADQVGLGKTIQLATAAMLMALNSPGPVLIIAPRTLLFQWQDELAKLLHLPSAVWDGKAWVDENGVRYENNDPEKAILRCPRQFGIVSQGLIVRGSNLASRLLEPRYTCVIVDEAHRSRRRNLAQDTTEEKAQPNNLMRFLTQISRNTANMLLATATPVQLYPIEAYDLLSVLGAGSEHVLGDRFSKWNSSSKQIAFQLVDGSARIEQDRAMRWDWIRNPFPPAEEDDYLFGSIRRDLNMEPTDRLIPAGGEANIKPWNRQRLENAPDLFARHNPYIRHIIRRTRKFLEETLNPETNEPYLQPVGVKLFGEAAADAIVLPGYLHDAYETAEEFCRALGVLMKGAGFVKTLLLRRMGSSLEAGRRTVTKMLGGGFQEEEEEEEDGEEEREGPTGIAARITDLERGLLDRLQYQLTQHQGADPKLARLRSLLFEEKWSDLGCIIFSQYFDTVRYFSEQIAIEHPEMAIGLYAGSDKSGIWQGRSFVRQPKELIKTMVQRGELRVLFGTDSASEGLNLQRLGTLINLDLPWNPTRLEQRKGRIQRIGQIRKEVWVYNMRYKDSVEDRVHQLLSQRLESIYQLFGQLPDVLEDVWIEVALGEQKKAEEHIRKTENRSPFEIRYDQAVSAISFESCTEVLNAVDIQKVLREAW